MSRSGLLSGSVLFEVEPERYDELVSKENELHLLKQAVADLPDQYNTGLQTIKKIFNIEKDVTENED